MPSCAEEFDIRTAAVNYPWTENSDHDAPSRKKEIEDVTSLRRETFDIEDVAWSNNEFKDYIATAARNGKIMLYNLKRPDIEIARLHEHLQQVHKVDFNPLEGGVLLSGSQDGTVRLWDLRNLQRSAMLCSSRETYQGRSNGVRHVKWSPTNTWTFAFSTDNGVVQRWDTRKNMGPVLKLFAHDGHCNSIDWHPDGKHLASAGKDGMVKVWNMNMDDRRPKAAFSLRAPHEVQNVRWRPSCYISESPDLGEKQCTHLATSYKHYPVVHVWDLRRPFVPFREVHHKTNTGTTDMLWRSRDLLWTVGPEGEFTQTDVPFAPRTVDRRPMSTFGCSPLDELRFYARKRPYHRPSRSKTKLLQETAQNDGETHSQNRDVLPFGRSPADDSYDEKFLGVSSRKRRSRTPSLKSTKSLAVTPPSLEDTAKTDTVDLKFTMNVYNDFDPSQTTKQGPLPGSYSTSIVTHLAQKWKSPPVELDVDLNYILNIRTLFDKNAKNSVYASRYRDAQTWRIFGAQAEKQLRLRAETNRRIRLSRKPELATSSTQVSQLDVKRSAHTAHSLHSQTNGNVEHETTFRPRAFRFVESTSNMSTPRVRPIKDQLEDIPNIQNPPSDSDSALRLPPSVVQLRRVENLSPAKGLSDSSEESLPNSAYTDWEEIAAERADREAYLRQSRPQPRVPLVLDQTIQQTDTTVPPLLSHHYSDDSFLMFATSTDSEPTLSNTGSFASDLSQISGLDIEDSNATLVSNQQNYKRRSRDSSTLSNEYDRKFAPEEHRNYVVNGMKLPQTRKLLVEDVNDYPNLVQTTVPVTQPTSKFSTTAHLSNGRSRSSSNTHKVDVSDAGDLAVNPAKYRSKVLKPNGQPPRLSRMAQSAPAMLSTETSPESVTDSFVLSDMLSTEYTSEIDEHDPVTATAMLRQLLTWYTDHSDSQMASQLFLLAAPLLAPPDSSPYDTSETPISPLAASYHEHLTSTLLGFDPASASDVLASHHNPLSAISISPAFAESFLSTYHAQLLTLNLLNPAAILRRLAYPAFPAVYDQGLKDVALGTLCLACNTPINNPTSKLRCETCRGRQSECPICCCLESPYDLPRGKKNSNSPDTSKQPQAAAGPQPRPRRDTTASPSPTVSLWSACPVCNHATHAACAHLWFADPEAQGACPSPGCTCDCQRGAHRDRRLAGLEAAEARVLALRREERGVGGGGGGGVGSGGEVGGGIGGMRRVKGALRVGSVSGMDGERGEEAKRVRVVVPDG